MSSEKTISAPIAGNFIWSVRESVKGGQQTSSRIQVQTNPEIESSTWVHSLK